MATNKPVVLTFKALTCLFLLAISMTCAASARILDEAEPPVVPVVGPPPEDTLEPEVVAPVATTTSPKPAAVQPAAGAAAAAASADHHPVTFFMHDILGGSNPSARVVTGVVSNPAVSGQLPFARPNGAVLPINGGVNLPNPNSNNGIGVNNNNLPFFTGLGGQSNTMLNNNNGNNIIGGNGLPFLNAGQLPSGVSAQKLLFGTMTVIDDVLTEGHDMGSGVVGKAQGFYVASSEDGTSQTMAFTALFQADHYVDSLTFLGVHRTITDESHLAVLGGTGKYVNAKGYAVVKTLHQEQHITDGVETLLELTVYLSY